MKEWLSDQIYAVGCLSIIAALIYFLFLFSNKKKKIERENKILKKYSPKCKGETREKKINQILSDPTEREFAKSKYLEEFKQKELDITKKRKIGYKYELDIFSIFDKFEKYDNKSYKGYYWHGLKEAPIKEELLQSIEEHFSVDLNNATQILKTWEENHLVCHSEGYYCVGEVLSFSSTYDTTYKLTSIDLTYEQWRAKNKYGNDIIEIFKNKEVPQEKMISIIEDFYSISNNEALDIFYKIWLDYDLVKEIKDSNSYSLAKAYKIGDILR